MVARDAEHESQSEDDVQLVGYAIVRYSAYIIITLAVLYFLANYVLPLF